MISIEKNYPLQSLNTFGINVVAEEFCQINTVEDLQTLYQSGKLNQKHLILGGGSNVLFTGDFKGLCLHVNLKGLSIESEEHSEFAFIKAAAGEPWHDVVEFSLSNNLSGIENLSLIPGSIGAAPIQNIGAYGVELKDIFHELIAFDIQSGELKHFDHASCKFGYRDSVFKQELKGKCIITSVTLRLRNTPLLNTSYGAIEEELKKLGEEINPNSVSRAVIRIRRSKLPDPQQLGNAGSFFKNPTIDKSSFEKLQVTFSDMPFYPVNNNQVKVPAGWLIEQCGLKGYRTRQCGVHEKQALVLVNFGGAQGKEIVDLSEYVMKTVKEKFGIELEREVNLI